MGPTENAAEAGLAQALALTEGELARERERFRGLREEARASQLRIAELERAVDHLKQASSGKQSRPTDAPSVSLEDGPIHAILLKMQSVPGGTFKVKEIQRFLEEIGFDLSPRYAANTLKRLHERGDLVRIGRGMYRLGNLHVHYPGLSQEDFED